MYARKWQTITTGRVTRLPLVWRTDSVVMPRRRGALRDTAIRPFVGLSVCPVAQAIGTLAACRLAMCKLRTRPRTDVDPPRVELPSAEGISSRRPRGDNLFTLRMSTAEITSIDATAARVARGAESM